MQALVWLFAVAAFHFYEEHKMYKELTEKVWYNHPYPKPRPTTPRPILVKIADNVNPGLEDLDLDMDLNLDSKSKSTTPRPPQRDRDDRRQEKDEQICPMYCNLTQGAGHIELLLDIDSENKLLKKMEAKTRKKRQVPTISEFDEQWIAMMKNNQHFLGQRLDHNKMTPEVRRWFRLKQDGTEWKWQCPICKKYEDLWPYKKTLGLEPTELLSSKCLNSDRIRNHMQAKRHAHSIELFSRDNNEIEKQRVFNSEGVSQSMIHMLQLVYVSAQTNIAGKNHQRLVKLLQETGSAMGDRYYSMKSFNEMLEFLSDQFQNKLVQKLMKGLPISMVLDGSDDCQNNHLLSVSFVTFSGNRPITYFYRLLDITHSQGAEAMMNTVVAAFKEDNLFEVMKTNLVGISTDGASVMSGHKSGFTKRLKTLLGREDIFSIW